MYLTHKDLEKYWVIDIEADSLNPTKIWCIVVKNIGTKDVRRFTSDPIHKWGDSLSSFLDWYISLGDSETRWVGHNATSYDVPVLNRLLGTNILLGHIVDTLVLSYLYDPKMSWADGYTGKHGPHSLDQWGHRLGLPKGNHTDFSQFSDEMLKYCEQDVEITCELFLKLTSRMKSKGFSEKSCELEHEIRTVLDEQQHNGFFFDIPRAEGLLTKFRDECASLAEPIQKLFPSKLVLVKELQYKTKADGTPYKVVSAARDRYDDVQRVGDTLLCSDYREFNLRSPAQRYQKLLELGWDPENMGAKRTKTGKSWQVDEDALNTFSGLCPPENKEAVQALANWIVLDGRCNMLTTWLEAVDRTDSCIHGTVFTCGARSRRMTHSNPNTANVPKASKKVKYGYECRSLWTARPGRVLVGYDASSLEMMMFCHYLNNPEVTKLYIEGKPHQKNADAWAANPWGLSVSYDQAKTGFYAGLYGAWDPKLGASIYKGGTKEMGEWARKKLYEITPGLPDVIERLEKEWDKTGGLIRTIDGGFVRCPKKSSLLNYACQSAGGIVMKQTSVLISRQARHLDHLKVGDIHDEGQHDVLPEQAQEFGEIAIQCLQEAGMLLNLNVPLTGDFKIGATWADTH